MGKKKFIAILTLLFLAIAALTANLIVAWLTDTATTGPTDFTLGDVSFEWSGAVSTNYVVPGENVVTTPYKLTNTSDPDRTAVQNRNHIRVSGGRRFRLRQSDDWDGLGAIRRVLLLPRQRYRGG